MTGIIHRTLILLLIPYYSLYSQNIVSPDDTKNEIGLILINDTLFQFDKDYTGSIGTSYQFSSIPLVIKYQIDVYTPHSKDRDLIVPEKNTHPYAGFGYLGAEYKMLNKNIFTILSIQIGSTGKYSFAENFQNLLHGLLNQSTFAGWESQIETKLGYVLNPRLEYLIRSEYFTLMPFVEIEAGNILSRQIMGFKILSGINYNQDFLYSRPSPKHVLDLFLTYEISNINKNVFLTGFDEYEYAVDIITPVHEIVIGLDWHYKSYRVVFQNHFRSKEYIGQKGCSKYSTLVLYFNF